MPIELECVYFHTKYSRKSNNCGVRWNFAGRNTAARSNRCVYNGILMNSIHSTSEFKESIPASKLKCN